MHCDFWLIMNVVCYERVCFERGLFWTWSVLNGSVMHWFVANGSVMNVVCYELVDYEQVCFKWWPKLDARFVAGCFLEKVLFSFLMFQPTFGFWCNAIDVTNHIQVVINQKMCTVLKLKCLVCRRTRCCFTKAMCHSNPKSAQRNVSKGLTNLSWFYPNISTYGVCAFETDNPYFYCKFPKHRHFTSTTFNEMWLAFVGAQNKGLPVHTGTKARFYIRC